MRPGIRAPDGRGDSGGADRFQIADSERFCSKHDS
ncbi:hypothetical protein QO016_002974 [Methylobacterium persicinum]|uniref:Uncharacterized protein n=1 Tax=Methylobacterium persicinum TaxID=374426 RepID=A0ABU0HPM9_9HYPH|nr:hypothetical protein [Methylobacterium persicinum]